MKIIEADVIIVGGGLSGLTAATQAAEKGASVICLEKAEQRAEPPTWEWHFSP